MKRIQWDQKVQGETGPEYVKATAYMTNVPGLICYRRPGGWYVGHLESGTVVNTYPVPKKEDAERLAFHFRDLTDWTRISFEQPKGIIELTLLELAEAVTHAELQFYAMKAWEVCDEPDCLANKLHVKQGKAHAAGGRTWKT